MRRFAFLVAFLLFTLRLLRRGRAAMADPAADADPADAGTERTAPVNGIKIWYAEFGQGAPVILLHGGLANANYWGLQVRCWRRTTGSSSWTAAATAAASRNAEPYGYDLMAADVLGLMDYLKIEKAAIVGWSDGAIIGLDIAIHHPERLTKLFAFAANSDPSGVADIEQSPVFTAYIARAEKEYEKLSPTPTRVQDVPRADHQDVGTQPNWTAERLKGSRCRPGSSTPTTTRRSSARTRVHGRHIPGAGLLIQPEVSHFSFLQDPAQFNGDVLHFLQHLQGQ